MDTPSQQKNMIQKNMFFTSLVISRA